MGARSSIWYDDTEWGGVVGKTASRYRGGTRHTSPPPMPPLGLGNQQHRIEPDGCLSAPSSKFVLALPGIALTSPPGSFVTVAASRLLWLGGLCSGLPASLPSVRPPSPPSVHPPGRAASRLCCCAASSCRASSTKSCIVFLSAQKGRHSRCLRNSFARDAMPRLLLPSETGTERSCKQAAPPPEEEDVNCTEVNRVPTRSGGGRKARRETRGRRKTAIRCPPAHFARRPC